MTEWEIIEAARMLLAGLPARTTNAATVAGYRALARRLVTQAIALAGTSSESQINLLIQCAKATSSAATWYTRRAALMYVFSDRLTLLVNEHDECVLASKITAAGNDVRETGHAATTVEAHDPAASEACQKRVSRIAQFMAWIERLQAEPGPAIEVRTRRRGKKRDVRGLPDNWREALIDRLPSYRLPAMVQAISGCRPAELVNGVKVYQEGEELVIEIAGAKVTDKSGQPWRRLRWPVPHANPLIAQLVERVAAGPIVVQIKDAKQYSNAFSAAARREWPHRRRSISPYCLRHAAASDMKAQGMKDDDISAGLGHCADKARSYYGQWNQGASSGGVAPKAVEAARPVKQKRKPKPKRKH